MAYSPYKVKNKLGKFSIPHITSYHFYVNKYCGKYTKRFYCIVLYYINKNYFMEEFTA